MDQQRLAKWKSSTWIKTWLSLGLRTCLPFPGACFAPTLLRLCRGSPPLKLAERVFSTRVLHQEQFGFSSSYKSRTRSTPWQLQKHSFRHKNWAQKRPPPACWPHAFAENRLLFRHRRAACASTVNACTFCTLPASSAALSQSFRGHSFAKRFRAIRRRVFPFAEAILGNRLRQGHCRWALPNSSCVHASFSGWTLCLCEPHARSSIAPEHTSALPPHCCQSSATHLPCYRRTATPPHCRYITATLLSHFRHTSVTLPPHAAKASQSLSPAQRASGPGPSQGSFPGASLRLRPVTAVLVRPLAGASGFGLPVTRSADRQKSRSSVCRATGGRANVRADVDGSDVPWGSIHLRIVIIQVVSWLWPH